MRLTLTKRAEYGIRMLILLARHEPDTRVTAAQIAKDCDIPAGNVPTVVSTLSRAGILSCSPGRYGGCALARAPKEISALDVIEALEGSLEIHHCILDSRRCHDHAAECAVHHAWTKGRDAAIMALANTSLADVIDRENELSGEVPVHAHRDDGNLEPTATARG